MRGTDTEQQSNRLGDETDRNSLPLCSELATKRVMEPTADREEALLLLNDYKMPQGNWHATYWNKRILWEWWPHPWSRRKWRCTHYKTRIYIFTEDQWEAHERIPDHETVVGMSAGKLVKALLGVSVGWRCVSAGLYQRGVYEIYLSWTVSVNSYDKIKQDAPSRVLRLVLTLPTEKVCFHWIRSY